MSSYSGPHRLERSRDDRFIAGVCGGAAKYLNMDPSVVRVLTVVLCFFTGVGVVVYLVAALVIPEEGSDRSFWQQNVRFGQQSRPADPRQDPTHPDGPIYGSDDQQN